MPSSLPEAILAADKAGACWRGWAVYVCDSCGARFLSPVRTEPIRCWGGGPDGYGVGHHGLGPVMRRLPEVANA